MSLLPYDKWKAIFEQNSSTVISANDYPTDEDLKIIPISEFWDSARKIAIIQFNNSYKYSIDITEDIYEELISVLDNNVDYYIGNTTVDERIDELYEYIPIATTSTLSFKYYLDMITMASRREITNDSIVLRYMAVDIRIKAHEHEIYKNLVEITNKIVMEAGILATTSINASLFNSFGPYDKVIIFKSKEYFDNLPTIIKRDTDSALSDIGLSDLI